MPIFDPGIFDGDVFDAGAGGGVVSLAGSVAATSSATSSLRLTVPLAASSNAASTGSSILRLTAALTGAANAVSGVSASLYEEVESVSSGQLGLDSLGEFVLGAGDEDVAQPSVVTLAGAVTGVSSANASLSRTVSLVAAATGTSTASANLTRTISLAASAAGVSTTTSNLTRYVGLASSSAAVSSATSSLTVTAAGYLAGASNAVSTASATLSRAVPLAAGVAATSSATSTLTRTVGLTGSVAAVSSATSTLTKVVYLSATTAGTSTATSTLTAAKYLTGATAAVSTAAAQLRRTVSLTASIAGTSTVTSNLTTSGIKTLAGTSSAHSTIQGQITGGEPVSGFILHTYPLSAASQVTVLATYGSTSIIVADGSIFSVGQYVLIGTAYYLIANVVGNVLTLSNQLLETIPAGQYVSGEVATNLNAGNYVVAHQTLMDMEQMVQHEPILVDMQDRYPVYVGGQVREREIGLRVYLIAGTFAQRRADYESLIDSLDSLSGLATLRWTTESGVTREYFVTVMTITTDAWFQRASVALIAPDAQARIAA